MHKYRTLMLPGNWSAEQAWSVLEFIYQLEELVWDAYEEKLLTIVGPDPPDDPSEMTLNFDPNSDDYIPF